MHQRSSGIAARLVPVMALGAVLALAPAASQAQRVYTDQGIGVASRAFAEVPASLAIELAPFALGDSLGGARFGAASAVNGSVASVGAHARFAGVQLGLFVGANGLGSLHREERRSFAMVVGRPLWSARQSSRISLTLGAVGSAGYRPSSEFRPAATYGFALGTPLTLRLRASALQPMEEERPWYAALRPAPAIAFYAAPVLAYGAQGGYEHSLFGDDTVRVLTSEALLPQLQFGMRLEGLGPLQLQAAWRHDLRGHRDYRRPLALGLGLTFR